MTLVSESALTAAVANDSRFIDNYIEFCLNSEDYKIALAAEDDLALAIALHEITPNVFTQMEVSKLAWQKKIENIWTTVQLFKQSDYYLDIFSFHEEKLQLMQPVAKPKPAIVAVATTAKEVVSDKSKVESKPKKARVAKVLPMPAIASLSELQGLDRKATVDAYKALRSNVSEVTLSANAASAELKSQLSKHVLGVDYVSPAKASRSKAKAAIAYEVPSDLSWDVVKGMKYRELQQLGKALRSNGLYQGNVAGKGINTEYLRGAIAQALGFNVVYANFTPEVAEVA